MIRNWIALVLLLVCGLVVLGSVSAQQSAASRTGWISDESCGTQHTKPGRADCVQKCWRGGASVGHPEWKPQRAAFVADDDQAIWIVENPEAVRNFPAAHVVLQAKFDSARKTIHVEKITPAAAQCIIEIWTKPLARRTLSRVRGAAVCVGCVVWDDARARLQVIMCVCA
jgi:hypothetical protein